MRLSPSATARFCELYRRGGEIDGRRILLVDGIIPAAERGGS